MDQPQSAAANNNRFSASQQKAWRAAFSTLVKMADDWSDKSPQRKMKIKSQKLHADHIEMLHELHQRWELMNPGGRWS